jgi:biopolymer transport protein ExbD
MDASPLPPAATEIEIGANGWLTWDGEPITPDELNSHLNRIAEVRPRPSVLALKTRPESTFGEAYDVLRRVQEHGLRVVLMLADAPSEGPLAAPRTQFR